jgi:hypothetical protein
MARRGKLFLRKRALFQTSLFLLCTTESVVNGRFSDDPDLPSFSHRPSLHTARSSTRAAMVRPETDRWDDTNGDVSFSISTGSNIALADRLAAIAEESKENEFLDRLLAAENETNTLVTKVQTPSLDWTIFQTSGLILIAGILVANNALPFWQDLSSSLSTVLSLSWLPMMWMRPSAATTRTFPLADLLVYVHVVAKPQTILYIKEHVWPNTVATLRKIAVAELWRRFWKVTYKQLSCIFDHSVFQSSSESSTNSGLTESNAWHGPRWLVDGHSFLLTTMQKKTQKILETTVQKHLYASIATVLDSTAHTIRSQVLSIHP